MNAPSKKGSSKRTGVETYSPDASAQSVESAAFRAVMLLGENVRPFRLTARSGDDVDLFELCAYELSKYIVSLEAVSVGQHEGRP